MARLVIVLEVGDVDPTLKDPEELVEEMLDLLDPDISAHLVSAEWARD